MKNIRVLSNMDRTKETYKIMKIPFLLKIWNQQI